MEITNSGNEFLLDESALYERLPRYVSESLTAGGNELPAVKRIIDWGGRRFVLTITPACLINRLPHGLDFGRRTLFPGTEEERIEMALRRLCVEVNINFDVRLSALCFGFGEFRSVYREATGEPDLTNDQLEKSLFVLFDSNYVLMLGAKEFFFRAIERIKCDERGDEKYYRVDFSPAFFDRDELFARFFENR
ncbi:MAG TPA: hypothetical protein VGC97_15850 [Pyrinomonadaceae bacterium]|jgi:hypothetical protein